MNSFLRWLGGLSNADAISLILAVALASSLVTMALLTVGGIAIVPLLVLLVVFAIVLLASKVIK